MTTAETPPHPSFADDPPSQDPGSDPAGDDPVRDRDRRLDRQRRPADDRQEPQLLAGRPLVGRQRLHAHLRRLPPPRRTTRRPRRPAADVHRRPDRLLARVARRRPRPVGGLAPRRPGDPGPRRGDHLSGGPLDPDDDFRRGRRAQQGARRLGRGRRRRRSGRRPARRDPDEWSRLGVGPLRQRPDRPRRRRDGAADAAREPGRHRRRVVRHPRGGHRDGRTQPAGLRPRRHGQRRLGVRRHARQARRRRDPDRRVPSHRAAGDPPADAVLDLPSADPQGIQRRRPVDRDVAVLDVLLHRPLRPERPRLLADQGRPRLPPAGDRNHPLGRRGVGSRHADRLQAGPDHGDAPDRGRTPVVLTRPHARRFVHGRHPRAVAARRRRPRLRLRSGDDRRDDRDRAPGGRPRVGPDQRVDPDRRRPRPGDPRDDRQQPDEGRRPRRTAQPADRPDQGLRPGLPRRRGVRDRRGDPRRRADLLARQPRTGGRRPGRRARGGQCG